MPNSARRPIALTIAGSDSGGGAGAQADLKTFAAQGVHGTSAITCITAQNPDEVRSIQAVQEAILRDQIEAVFATLSPAAVKTGMLYSRRLIEVVVKAMADRSVPIVVDPVMVATSGARLLESDAIEMLKTSLLSLATIITPNLDETSLLLKRDIQSEAESRTAARELADIYGCSVLVKGGHRAGEFATDFLFDGTELHELKSQYVPNASTHGSGCTLSAAIAANLALGHSIGESVETAKRYITETIQHGYPAGRHSHLNHLPDVSAI